MTERVGQAEPSTGGPAAARLRPLRSVRVRITLAAALVTAVAIATAGWLLVWSVEDSQLGAIRDHTEDLLDRVTERLAAGVPPERTVHPRELTTSFVEIVYEDGTSIKLVPTYYLSDGASDEVGVRTFREGPGSSEPAPSDGIVADSPTPTIRMPIVSARTVDTPAGEVTVTVAAPVDQVARSLDAVRRALAIGFPVLVGLVALAAWWIVGRALRPVELIRTEADAISASTLHRRVPEPGTGDEVHRLSRTMNAMLERLEGAVRRQGQFVADASHELRNPVAGIRTDVEVALCEPDRADWLQVAHGVLAAEARLETLIDDLLVLAAEDEGAATLPTTEVDLTELATTEARRSRKVPVSSATAPGGVVVVGSYDQLQRALANLVDNAERHARSQVRIGTTDQAGWAQLWVDDDGPGIPPADRDRVFERFTRLDDGRGRDEGGSGLGLAVVRSIVTRHRGGVWTEESPLGGARFVIALPAPDPSDPSSRPRQERNGSALPQNRLATPQP
ncbi:MAG TPA: ATP-binding protein [Acidimicrobiales bacterium]